MTPERWVEVKCVLVELLAETPSRRDRLLDSLCGEDAELRLEVESLAAFESQLDDGFFSHPAQLPTDVAGPPRAAGEGARRRAAELEPGQRVDAYEIHRLLGEGGMGAVYLAYRADDFHKQVALKLIRRGQINRASVLRFQHERQILAELEHPSIARLLDGGSTVEGSPYLVMEYVEGETLDRYCASHELNLETRLDLFRQICEAVHFAHQRQIIHRDLKPGNILVTAAGVPKLLDFGIAELAREGVSSPSLGHHAMTPRYASPEQLRGEAATTASDIYSLGVLLCRLLTGRLPPGANVAATASEPQRLSEIVGAPTPAGGDRRAPAAAGLPPSKTLAHRLRGDLDAMAQRCLANEPEDRYGSAWQLADDVRRTLEQRPVAAREGTLLYPLVCWVRRHQLAAAATVLLLLLAVGLTFTAVRWWQTDRLREQEALVANFVEDLLTTSRLLDSPDGPATAEKLLQRIHERVPDRPDLQATLTLSMGRIYQKRGHYNEARKLIETSLDLRRRLYPRAHERLARGINVLAVVLDELGEFERAEALFREALAMRLKLTGEQDEEYLYTLNNLASLLAARGDLSEAAALYRRNLELRAELYGADSPEAATALNSFGAFLFQSGEPADAESYLRQALEIRQPLYGSENLAVATSLNNLARVLQALDRPQESESLYREALTLQEKLRGAGHPHVAAVLRNLATLRLQRGDAAECEILIDRTREVFRATLPAGHWRIADADSVAGGCLAAQGRLTEAEPLLRESLAILQREKGDQAMVTREALARLRMPGTASGGNERRPSRQENLGGVRGRLQTRRYR